MAIKERRKKIDNPRFPHWCKIYRISEVNPFGEDGEAKVLYEGECRIYANTSIRIFHDNTDAGRVVSGDMAMAIPLTVHDFKPKGKMERICDGDSFDGRDGSRELTGMVISDIYVGTMGSIVGFSKTKN